MKKLWMAIPISVLIIFTLVSCVGSSEQQKIRDDTYALGKQALEIEGQYMDEEIAASEALERLNPIYEQLEALTFSDDEITQSSRNFSVANDLYLFTYALSNTGNEDDLKEAYDNLREHLAY